MCKGAPVQLSYHHKDLQYNKPCCFTDAYTSTELSGKNKKVLYDTVYDYLMCTQTAAK